MRKIAKTGSFSAIHGFFRSFRIVPLSSGRCPPCPWCHMRGQQWRTLHSWTYLIDSGSRGNVHLHTQKRKNWRIFPNFSPLLPAKNCCSGSSKSSPESVMAAPAELKKFHISISKHRAPKLSPLAHRFFLLSLSPSASSRQIRRRKQHSVRVTGCLVLRVVISSVFY